VACFPLRLVGASAAPARVVAILDHAGGEKT
jgi:kynurenine formamidase